MKHKASSGSENSHLSEVKNANLKRAVFFDRDGTIARDVPYCGRVEDFHLLPDAAEAISMLNRHGFQVVVATNQSGIARGYFDLKALHAIHDYMCRTIAKQGGRVDAVYYCPHHPDDTCSCRKPRPGMLLMASRDLGIDLGRSFIVGDQQADVMAAHAVDCKAVLIAQASSRDGVKLATGATKSQADYRAGSLLDAVNWILKEA